MEVLDLSESSKAEQAKHAALLRTFEETKRARTISVPTSIDEVKNLLRSMGHPVTLFGEGPYDRRERLKRVVASLQLDEEQLASLARGEGQVLSEAGLLASKTATQPTASSTGQKNEIFYTPASSTLISARKLICDNSFKNAQVRLLNAKRVRDEEGTAQGIENNNSVAALYANSKKLSLVASQFGDERPLTCVRVERGGDLCATSSLGMNVKLWDMEAFSCVSILRGHEERVTSLSWYPSHNGDPQASAPAARRILASTSADKKCLLWNCSDVTSNDSSMSSEQNEIKSLSPIKTLQGHVGVVSDCEFHPHGAHIGTASDDYSWRLWDIESGEELLLQDGHITNCSLVTFHPDGSLVLTGDAAGVALLWDIRSGQQIHAFQGHIKKITCGNFSCNGFQVVTGGLDNTVRVWDLRKKKCTYTLPAHNHVISDVRFSASGELLLTSSFDGSVRVWGSRDYRLLKSLQGHSGKVMSCDFCPSERQIVSAGFDRTIKKWSEGDF